MKALPVARLSSIVSSITTVVRDRFGLNRVWIGGGSAPALLDHLFGGNALRMRDFDLVLVAERPVDEELARQIGEAVDSPDLQFLPRYVYPRMRSRCGEELWLAGWGLLWSAHGMEVDLSIFHDHTALELNGLMNIDRIRIPLVAGTTLNDIAAAMLTTGSAQRSIASGLAEDPCGGYPSWVHRAPAIVAWNAIHASPIECALRIVRSCVNKLHLFHLRAELADPLRAAIVNGRERGDRFVRVRNLLKLFHDDRAGIELEMMHSLGAFDEWIPDVGELIERAGDGALAALFAESDRTGKQDADHRALFAKAGEQGGDETSALRLEAMLLQMPGPSRDRVLDEVAIAEPTFAALVRKQLPRVERRRGKRPATKVRIPTAAARIQALQAMNAPVDLTT
ncbi:MAG TPA: hypothetical protein VG323_18795 [Thermoanaerobaculia bacterium]|nr:hypothetical protein [Thermoanaerobaculia bacterium]